MNNVYYRAVHLISNAEYGEIPPRLRMQAIANPGVDRTDFELWCTAVSAVNGCGKCLDSHERELRQRGVGAQAVVDVLRIAAILHAVACVLDGERALAVSAGAKSS
jgi:alkyl hydroperoxide reductase subunit D